jgi:hypothetical protein
VTIPLGTCSVFTHSLGSDPDEYAVDLWFWDLDDGWGVNRRYYGGLEDNGATYGVHWQGLTADMIGVCRGSNDDAADRVRIHVWDPPATPDLRQRVDEHQPGPDDCLQPQLRDHGHGLDGGPVVQRHGPGIHQFGYGGLGVDGPKRMLGRHWHDLTDNTVEVTRHPHDTDIQQVRVLVVHGGPSQYDSLEDVGGWQPIAPGTTRTFSHNLDWKPEMLLVRGECFSPTVSGMGGIHHWFAGGNHGWIAGWQGTNVQNVTSNTLEVFRQPDDQICPQFRVRIWKRGFPAYLPLVMLSS